MTRPANEYVRSFVANVNPLNVLRLGSLMCPCDRLEAEDGWLWLDRRISLRVQLDGDGRPLRLTCADRDLGLIDGIDGLADLGATSENLVRAAPGAPIRLAIEGIRRSGWPVAVADAGRPPAGCGPDRRDPGRLATPAALISCCRMGP